jgi:hypothetical protein
MLTTIISTVEFICQPPSMRPGLIVVVSLVYRLTPPDPPHGFLGCEESS